MDPETVGVGGLAGLVTGLLTSIGIIRKQSDFVRRDVCKVQHRALEKTMERVQEDLQEIKEDTKSNTMMILREIRKANGGS